MREAHTLRSTAQLIEAKRLAELCQMLEVAAKANDTENVRSLAPPVCEELSLVVDYLRDRGTVPSRHVLS
jgi:HPt (histidine-containing phosphotransfer) domain-containing protein